MQRNKESFTLVMKVKGEKATHIQKRQKSYLFRDTVKTLGGLWTENLFKAGTFCLHLENQVFKVDISFTFAMYMYLSDVNVFEHQIQCIGTTHLYTLPIAHVGIVTIQLLWKYILFKCLFKTRHSLEKQIKKLQNKLEVLCRSALSGA